MDPIMYDRPQLSRRDFMLTIGGAVLGAAIGCRSGPGTSDLDAFITGMLELDRAPGFAGAVVVGDRLQWSAGYGWADIGREIAMSPDTLQNIGSVSKTVTATAVMQLWEAEQLQLDDDVGLYLPYSVRNPRYADVPITFRQLLTHRSSIKDGPAYGESYACGDPLVTLGEWIEEYLKPGGVYYDPDENFHSWEPGTVDPPSSPRAYSNVAFGLLGVLVQHVSDRPFNEYCRERIFAPLGMGDSGWFLAEIDTGRHAVPYTLIPESFEIPEGETIESFLPADDAAEASLKPGSYFPHCLYSFFNYPDGLVRTSVNELSRFLRAYVNGGVFDGARMLEPATTRLMLSNDHYGRGLCWSTRRLRNGDFLWGHGGGDPGISTYMGFRQRDNVGVIMFYNFNDAGDGGEEILERLFAEGEEAAG
jgi:CubicO group peptidase (beta-lactamase class C family)